MALSRAIRDWREAAEDKKGDFVADVRKYARAVHIVASAVS